VNRKKVQRLWQEEGLRVPPKKRKRQRAGDSDAGAGLLRAERPDHVWSLDYQFDVTALGRKFKILHVIDEFTRERMNLELLRIWEQTGKTVIFVTHSISEAIFLSNRVVVMSPRPGRITKIVSNDLPYPRDFMTRNHPAYHNLVSEVRELLRDAIGSGSQPHEE